MSLLEANPMRGGKEHRVAWLPDQKVVLKVADARKLATESLFDYLRDPAPRALGGNFILDHDLLGEVDVFDLHPNNVIQDTTGWLHPIDAHFYFDNRAARIAALKTLGLLSPSLEERAQRGTPGDLRRILDMVPDVPPMPGDER